MLNVLRPIKLLPALAVTVVVAAVSGVPTASADTAPTAWLHPNGVLSYTGIADNDWVKVTKVGDPSAAGGYVIRLEILRYTAPNFSANCTIGGGLNDWLVECPGASVKKLTYDGQLGGDSFNNTTNLPSEAHGGPGVDVFYGGTTGDVLYGDGDKDILYGGGGDDVVDGGADRDQVAGNSGTDIASWGDATSGVNASLDGVANDGVAGENENLPADFEGIQGGPYADKLSGTGGAADTLLGGGGPDDLEGWGGDDTLKGEGGDDTLHANSGSDVLDGGPDTDSLSYAVVGQSVYVYQDGNANDGAGGEKDNVTSVEHLTGSSYGDDLEGTEGDDVIDGNGGGDKITPKFGDDTIYGGAGPDNISGGPGVPSDCGNSGCTKFDTDTVWGGSGSDTIDYSSRDDNLKIAIDGSSKSGGSMENDDLHQMENANGGSGNDAIYGNDYPNSLTGGAGGDGIVGYKGNDYVSGGPGNDFVEGDGGNDYMVGGEDSDVMRAFGGDDTLAGGSGTDRVSYDDATSGVTAYIGMGASGPSGESDKIESDVEDIEGSPYADKLYGNGTANRLIGRGSADLLVGAKGSDMLEGGWGPDTLKTAGDGIQDSAFCHTGNDVAYADKIDSVSSDCETVNKSCR